MRFEDRQYCHAYDKDRRLAVACLSQFLRRALKTNGTDVKIHNLRRAIENLPGFRMRVVKILSHPRELRALPGEKVGYVHSITMAPQTRPLPKVASAILSPFLIRPCSRASQS